MPTMDHKAGPLKQQNKSHKTGQHSSKRLVARQVAGRVSLKKTVGKSNRAFSRQERKQQLVQLRRLKREEIAEEKRRLGGLTTPPFLVAIVPVHAVVDGHKFIDLLKKCHDDVQLSESPNGCLHLNVPQFKKRYSFVVCKYDDPYSLMDTVRVADVVILLYDHEDGYDSEGDVFLSILLSQGLPTPIHVTCPSAGNDPKTYKKSDMKKHISKLIEDRFPDEKVHCIQTQTDSMLLLQQVADIKKRKIHMREHRSYLLVEDMRFEPNDENNYEGTLKVSGYLRGGRPLNANRLVHIPGYGDFQIGKIEAPNDPFALKQRGTQETDMDEDPKVLQISKPEERESLDSEIPLDPMEGEQTFPTPEELEEAEREANTRRKLVPKGTSSYQAAWILDDDFDEMDGEEDSADEEDDQFMDAEGLGFEARKPESDEDEEEWVEAQSEAMTDVPDEVYDKKVDFDEETQMLEKFRKQRQEMMFPDEIDTPQDMKANMRFQRYRGLKSFQASPWDPKENLPQNYARIYQFKSFHSIRRKMLRVDEEEELEGAMSGWYVTLHLLNVPHRLSLSRSTLTVFGLLPHENKMSVLNVAIKRHHSFTSPVASKERLIFHVGCRRFANCPIFSEHALGSKHKFQRFLPLEGVCVATMFAPITFPPASVLVFKESADGAHQLVATGSVLSVDPDRMVIKRAVLSGHPYKINKRSAVIRYMFFNRDDIMWFKPVELRTKYGMRGHIKEPLGTHGHMKCVFNAQLKSMDTILMNLYKRVYPKWTYESLVVRPKSFDTFKMDEGGTQLETMDTIEECEEDGME